MRALPLRERSNTADGTDVAASQVILLGVALIASVYLLLVLWLVLPGAHGLLRGSRSYSLLAADIVNGGSFSSTYRPPLYPMLLAGLMVLSDDWSLSALVVQAALGVSIGAALVLLTFRITQNPVAAGVAGVLYAGHLLLHLEVLSERETALFTALNLAFLSSWLFIAAGRTRHFCMAVTAALLYLTRPTGTLYVPLLMVAVIFDLRRVGVSEIMKRISVCLGLVCAVVLPWQIFVSFKVGELRLSPSTTVGVNIFKGNNPHFEQFFPLVDVDLYEPFIRDIAVQNNLSGPSSDEALKDIAVRYIIDNPLQSLGRAIQKALLFFSPVPVPLGTGRLVRSGSGVEVQGFAWRSRPLIVASVLHTLVIFIGVVLCLSRAHSGVVARFLVGAGCLVSMFVLAHCLTFPETRFRIPLDVLLIAASAIGLAGGAPSAFRCRRQSLNELDRVDFCELF